MSDKVHYGLKWGRDLLKSEGKRFSGQLADADPEDVYRGIGASPPSRLYRGSGKKRRTPGVKVRPRKRRPA